MILINKYTKLSSHMTSMTMNGILLIEQIMLIGLSNVKFLLKGIKSSTFSNDHTVVAALSAGTETNFLWNSLIPFFKFLKVNLSLG